MGVLLKPFEAVIGLLSDTKKSTGTMDSASKMVTNGWKTLETGFEIAHPAMKNFAKQLGTFTDLIGALNVLDRAYEWISPQKRADWTWQKYLSQATLTVSHTLEGLNFFKTAGFFDLGSFASEVAPGIIPLEVMKFSFYLPASIFGIWHSAVVMGEQSEKVASLEGKVTKWTDRLLAGQNKAHFLNVEIPQKLQQIAQEMTPLANKMNDEGLDRNETRTYSRLVNRQRRWLSYAEELRNGDESASLKADCQKKINGYTANVTVAEANKGKVQTKEWLGIANNVGKLAMGIIGLIGIFMGLFALPVFAATFAAGWFATHGLNFAKGIYEERNKVEAYQKPHLAAAAAA